MEKRQLDYLRPEGCGISHLVHERRADEETGSLSVTEVSEKCHNMNFTNGCETWSGQFHRCKAVFWCPKSSIKVAPKVSLLTNRWRLRARYMPNGPSRKTCTCHLQPHTRPLLARGGGAPKHQTAHNNWQEDALGNDANGNTHFDAQTPATKNSDKQLSDHLSTKNKKQAK